ncbi:MAG: hypothetical protein FWD26_00500 [Treponema sp.]|nr:hypothetical protein [Treponema sp.]
MKKKISVLILMFVISGICSAGETSPSGTVRFNLADNFINLHNALPGIYITWTPYILPNLGIPVQVDINFGWGVLPGIQISLLSGVEYIPIGPKGKKLNGLFIDAKIGLSLFYNENVNLYFVSKANVGYQFVTKRGFVFTPGAGIVYNMRGGMWGPIGINLMLDAGFSYNREKK